jgi:hypothetical protein
MDSVYTRSGTRRFGDDYQDIVALETIVDFLEHKYQYQYILVEATSKGSLDDVVSVKKDGSFELKQVKFSGYPDTEGDAWTWEKLTEKDYGEKSLIEKWASSFELVKKQGKIFKASVESNRRSDEIQGTLDRDNHVILDKITDTTIKNKIIEQIGGEERAKEFFSIFCFNLNRPNLSELEASVKKRFFGMGVTQNGWMNLKDELRSWVREKNKPLPEGRITYEIIKKAVNWLELKQLNEKFPVPSDFVVPSEKFHEQLLKDLKTSETGCIVITAPPGMGKSTYLSFLYNYLDSIELPVIRHHYYISEQDRTVGRSKPEAVAESMMSEIKSKYPDFLGDLQDKNVDFEVFSSWLDSLGKEFRKKEKSLIIIIDGLDHAWREKQSFSELADFFEHIFPTPKGVVVIIGTQPIDDQKVPPRLLQAAPREKWRQLPPLDLKALRKWIVNYESKISLPKENEIRNNILDNFAEALHKKSGGLPLYLHYAMKKIQEQELEINLHTIEGLPECPHDGVTGYYKMLLQSLCDEGRQILYLLATCPLPWNQNRIVECLEPKIPNTSQIIKSVRETRYLMKEDICGLTLFHNSLYVFLKEQPDYSTYSSTLRPLVLSWLDKKAPEYIRWQYLWLMKAENGDEEPLIMGPNRKWVVEAISKSFPRNGVSQILSRSALAALRKKNMVRVVEIGFLLDYYNSVFDFQSESIDNLFFAQLATNDDTSFTAFICSNILVRTHKQLLHFSECNKEKQALVKDCYNELYERQRGNRYESYREDHLRWRSLINSFLGTAALLEDINLTSFVERLIKAESEGIPDALDIFCQALRKNRKSSGFRELLKLSMPQKDLSAVLRHAILLSFEEGFDLSNEVLSNSTHPFAAIYASTRGLSKYSIGSIEFPSTSLFDLIETNPYSKNDELAQTFYDLFFIFAANCLWHDSKRNDEWIEQVNNWWIKEFITLLNEAAKELPQLINNPSKLSFDWLYGEVNSLRRPTWLEDRHNVVYGECAEKAVNQIALDLFTIIAATGKKSEITKAELENAFSTQYFDPWTWIDMLVSLGRNWLSKETLNWVKSELELRINSSIKPFSERAINYSRLAALFALHRNKEFAKAFVEKAADNLLAHGYHKDITLFLVLDALEFCYNAKVPETKNWLMQTIPAILWVTEFTDGDETRYLPKELGDIISKYEPNILPSLYDWLIEQEDYDNANALIHSFIENADLSDPINKAIAQTAIDEKSLLLLHERSKTENDAKIILSSIIKVVGESAISKANKKKEEEFSKSDHDNFKNEDLPNPGSFPPEKFKEYLMAAKSKIYFSNYLEKWIGYWKDTSQNILAYNSIKKEVDKGTVLKEYDSLFDLSFSVVGKEEAYHWLAKAQIEQYGWDSFTSRDAIVKRWETIKRHYANRWFEFIKDTLEPMFSERWKFVSAHIFARLIEYCFYMQETELAKAISMQAVISARELVSPTLLPKPKWVEENEPIEQA